MFSVCCGSCSASPKNTPVSPAIIPQAKRLVQPKTATREPAPGIRKMNMSRLILFALLAFTLAGALAKPAQAREPEVIRFGVCIPLSGSFQYLGHTNLAGIKLRLDDINEHSDETGIRLEMLLRDNESNPQRSADIVDEFADMGLSIIIGPCTTDVIFAMIPRARARGVVLLSPSVSMIDIHKRSDGWAFRVMFGDDHQAVALAKFAVDDLKLLRAAAIVNTRFLFGNSIYIPFSQAYEHLGGEVLKAERYQWDLNYNTPHDFTGILARIKAIQPEVILVPGFAEEASQIIHQSQSVGIQARFLGGDGWFSSEVILASGNNLEGSYFLGGRDTKSTIPEMQHFNDLLDRSFDPAAEPASMHGYDCVTLTAEAAKAGARTGEEIRNWLFSLKNYRLVCGDVTFDRETGNDITLYLHKISHENDSFISTVVSEYHPEELRMIIAGRK